MATEKITLLRVADDSLATVERSITTEQADRIAAELLDAHTSEGEELLLVRARRGKLSLIDAIVPAQVLARTVAALDAIETAHESVAALIARAGLPGDADIATALPTLTWHTTKPLQRAGLRTIAALAAATDEYLREVPQFGERRLAALKTALREAS